MQVSVVQFRPWAPQEPSPSFVSIRRTLSRGPVTGASATEWFVFLRCHPDDLLVSLLVLRGALHYDTNMLNDVRVRSAKSGARPIKLSDAGGLHLLIQPHGTKLWRLAY